ncbi:MAG TPA: hypothetical protein PLZ43_04905 [bacterium]|nr:hypothetical protein [bacterium]
MLSIKRILVIAAILFVFITVAGSDTTLLCPPNSDSQAKELCVQAEDYLKQLKTLNDQNQFIADQNEWWNIFQEQDQNTKMLMLSKRLSYVRELNFLDCQTGIDCFKKGEKQKGENNPQKALLLFEKACEFQNAEGCDEVSYFYSEGKYVEEDLFEAKKYLEKAGEISGYYFSKLRELPSPSYDCGKASNYVEKTICKHSGLSILDCKLAQQYRTLMRISGSNSEHKKAQRSWISERSECKDVNCIEDKFLSRLEKLNILLSGQSLKSFSGKYFLGNNCDNPGNEGVLEIQQQNDAAIKFSIGTAGASMHTGDIDGVAYINKNKAEFDDKNGCKITFKISTHSIIVTDEGCSLYGGARFPGFGGEYF